MVKLTSKIVRGIYKIKFVHSDSCSFYSMVFSGSLPLVALVLQWFLVQQPLDPMAFQWFQTTIGKTMEW